MRWYIMTSPATDAETKKHFRDHGFFGLKESQVGGHPPLGAHPTGQQWGRGRICSRHLAMPGLRLKGGRAAAEEGTVWLLQLGTCHAEGRIMGSRAGCAELPSDCTPPAPSVAAQTLLPRRRSSSSARERCRR